MGVKFSQNLEYLLTRPGLMKLMSLVIGLISLGLGVHGVEDSKYNQFVEEELESETFFESSVVGSFLFSFVYLALLCFSDDLANSNINRYVDTIYHAIAGKTLFLAGILLIISARHIETLAVCKTYYLFIRESEPQCQLLHYKVVGGAFSIINAVLYELTAYFAFTTKDLT